MGRGPLDICVDTGFTGDLSLPREVLKKLRLRYVGTMDYQLANGRVETIDQHQGIVIAGDYEYEAMFMEGEWLLGMDFIQEVCRDLRLDIDRGTVTLTLRR